MNLQSQDSFFNGDKPVYHLAEEPHHPEGHSTMLGFWIYLMSDCLIFAVLFATFAVSSQSFAGGPGPREMFELPLVAVNTAMLLFSSITYGFAMLVMEQGKKGATLLWLAITGLFGLAFLGIELYEFSHLFGEGVTPQTSAYWSAFFTLVGTHGLHVTFGLIWLVTLMGQTLTHGLTRANKRRMLCLSMFWHFLDVVWIGVFTFVYLMGVV
ncbi:cytochrome o ubiquinol oxidase subunit III [Parasphingorhabdus halotolerans]|uniref:Cytochrome bo(3) ubiquinol oxidase subunit 3 n=1 Tax=Parasphingorhabdus halotolerans TaxID=2725558 RepID=A0A6H2DRK9_9SPHN|nr:cytochrome o ubiquinol oxidase subunit III [Parasphingorhabdus halotolerans]QJB70296.1 cytochrome o ubiquinol oxidase subunit III [Parasphingorhabdus halotolerans]